MSAQCPARIAPMALIAKSIEKPGPETTDDRDIANCANCANLPGLAPSRQVVLQARRHRGATRRAVRRVAADHRRLDGGDPRLRRRGPPRASARRCRRRRQPAPARGRLLAHGRADPEGPQRPGEGELHQALSAEPKGLHRLARESAPRPVGACGHQVQAAGVARRARGRRPPSAVPVTSGARGAGRRARRGQPRARPASGDRGRR